MCVRKALNVLPWRVRFRLPNTVNCAVTARLVRRLANRSAAAGRALDLRSRLGTDGRRVRRGVRRLRLRRRLRRADDLRAGSSDGRRPRPNRRPAVATRLRHEHDDVRASAPPEPANASRSERRRLRALCAGRGPVDRLARCRRPTTAGARLRRQLPPVQGRLRPARADRSRRGGSGRCSSSGRRRPEPNVSGATRLVHQRPLARSQSRIRSCPATSRRSTSG